MSAGEQNGRAERIGAVTRITRQIILMPRGGAKNIIVRERAISLPRVSILESEGGFAEDNGPMPYRRDRT